VGEAIEGSSGEAFAAEDFGPVLEREVRGDDEAVPLIGSRDDIE